MEQNHPQASCGARPHCALCHQMIGVYEPLVLAREGGHRETSLAVEPGCANSADTCYHRHCFRSRD